MEHLVVAEPPAHYGGAVPIDEQLLGRLHLIRGQQVVLDRDLAVLFGVELHVLRAAVRESRERLPEAFMFELTRDEDPASRSQQASLMQGEQDNDQPLAFTEAGVLMLAPLLPSAQAIAVSIRLVELFVRMRQALFAHQDILLRLAQLERRVGEPGADIQQLFQQLRQLLAPPSEPRTSIGFKPTEA
ncbi:MAG: ORF6N domain-containing protein [Flavobacteriales bacterium]